MVGSTVRIGAIPAVDGAEGPVPEVAHRGDPCGELARKGFGHHRVDLVRGEPGDLVERAERAVGDKVHVGIDQSGQHGAVPDLHDVDVLGQIREAVLDAGDPVAVDDDGGVPGDEVLTVEQS